MINHLIYFRLPSLADQTKLPLYRKLIFLPDFADFKKLINE